MKRKEIVKVERYFPEGAKYLLLDWFETDNEIARTIEIIPRERLVIIECDKEQEEPVKNVLRDIFLNC